MLNSVRRYRSKIRTLCTPLAPVQRSRWRENIVSKMTPSYSGVIAAICLTLTNLIRIGTRKVSDLSFVLVWWNREIDRGKKERGKKKERKKEENGISRLSLREILLVQIYKDSIGIRRLYLPHRCLRERRWPCQRTEVTETSSKSWVNRWCWASRWKCSRTWSPFQWRSICWRSWRTAPGISGFSRARKRSRKATTPPYKIEHRGRSPCSSRPPPWCWLKWKLCTRSSSLSSRSLGTNWSSPWKKFQKRVTFESYLDFLILVFGRRAAQNFIRYLLRTILDALSNE